MKALNRLALAAAVALAVGAAPARAADGTRVGLVPGGPHPYFAAWEQAAKDAAKDFHLAGAEYKVPQKWELSQQNQLLESMLSQGFNAFVIFPGDSVGSASTVGELSGDGAPVIAGGGCLKDPSDAAFCLGTDTGRSAYLGTQELIKAMGAGPGKRIAHFTGFLVDPNTQLRIDAVAKAAGEAGAKVVQVIADIDAPEPAEEKINAYLAAHAGEVDGVIATAWVPAVVAANAMRKIGDKRIKMVGIDHDEVVLKAIRDGFVAGTMIQNPYGQGYVGAYAVDRLRSGCKVKADAPFTSNALTKRFIDSGTAFIGPDKVDGTVDVMRATTKDLLANFAPTYLTCP